MFLGRSEDGFAGLETALRLSPRDRRLPNWQYYICHLHTHLAQWEQAIEWCNKAHAGSPGDLYPLVDLAAANAWAGHDKEAKEAVAQLQKVLSRLHRADMGGHPLDRRSDLQRAIRAHRRRPAQGRAAGGGEDDELKRLRERVRCSSLVDWPVYPRLRGTYAGVNALPQ